MRDSEHSPTTPRHRKLLCWLALAVAIVLTLNTLLGLRAAVKTSALRGMVTEISYGLNTHGIDYWWDFTTLLGIVRDGDMVGADEVLYASIAWETWDALVLDHQLRAYWASLGSTLDVLGDHKARLRGCWGWSVELIAWSPESTADGRRFRRFVATEAVIVHLSGLMQPSAIFSLIAEDWLMPTRFLNESQPLTSAVRAPRVPGAVRLPAQPRRLLQLWYGSAQLNTPRPPHSLNLCDAVLAVHIHSLPDLLNALQFLLHLVVAGLAALTQGVFSLANLLGILPIAVATVVVSRHPRLHGAGAFAALTVGATAASALVMALTLAVAGA